MIIHKEIRELKGNFDDRLKFAMQILENPKSSSKNKALINALFEAIQQDKPLSIRAAAIFLLSKMKIKKIIPELIQQLDDPVFYTENFSTFLNYTPTNGLLEFGKSAVNPLEEKLKSSEDSQQIALIGNMLFTLTRDHKRIKNLLLTLQSKSKNKAIYKDALQQADNWITKL